MSPLSDPLLENAPLRRLVVFAVLAGALVLSCFHVSNLDIGGHVTVGREIILTKSIPKTDFFSHTAQGRSYPVHQWFGELVLFGVEHVTGPTGLILLRMIIVLLGGALLYRNARNENAPVVAAAAIALLLLVAARPRFLIRPFLVTLVFLPLLLCFVSRASEARLGGTAYEIVRRQGAPGRLFAAGWLSLGGYLVVSALMVSLACGETSATARPNPTRTIPVIRITPGRRDVESDLIVAIYCAPLVRGVRFSLLLGRVLPWFDPGQIDPA